MDIWSKSQAMDVPRELKFAMQPINAEKCNEELRLLLPDTYISMDTGDTGILIRMSEKASEADIQAVSDHLKAHDPAAKSAAELKRDDQQTALTRLAVLDVDRLQTQLTDQSDPLLVDILAILRDVRTYFEGLT